MAGADILNADEALARRKLGRRISWWDGLRPSVFAIPSDGTREWTAVGDEVEKERVARGGLWRKSSKDLLRIVVGFPVAYRSPNSRATRQNVAKM